MGQSLSQSPDPSRGEQDYDLEASNSNRTSEQSGNIKNSKDSFEQPERYVSVPADQYCGSREIEVDRKNRRMLDEEYKKLYKKYGAKLDDYGDAIQPHTDEGGDAYFIGDAYAPITNTFAKDWVVKNRGPYLQFVKQVAKTWKHLEYLGHWMEVTCAPPKWKFLRQPGERMIEARRERAARTKACVIDYTNRVMDDSQVFVNSAVLKKALEDKPQTTESHQARLIVVEDLSRDVIEALGGHYNIDPLFFASHIGDYLFHNTRDRWVELPSLDVDARKMSHFCLSYLRARYFETEEDFYEAERQTGKYNVLRRLDSDRSRKRLQGSLLDLKHASVALSRAKTSLWVRPRKPGEPVTAILLVDPTVKTDHSHPLMGGYRPFTETPSMTEWRHNPDQIFDAPEGKSLFEDVVYWTKRLTPEELELVDRDPRCMALSMFKLVVADWLTALKYMTTMLGKMEWEFEKPHWGGDPQQIDDLLKKLSPWRRNIGYYETMISEAIARLFPPEIRAPLHASATAIPTFEASAPTWATEQTETGVRSLWTDFQNVKCQMDEIHARIKSIEQTATNGINIEETRRAVEESQRSVKQNKNLARLTFLATIFIPLNFTSSFLSISPDFPTAHQTIWLFFVIGIPLTCLALLAVDLSHPEDNGFCKRRVRRWKGEEERKSKKTREQEKENSDSATASTSSTENGPSVWTRPTFRRQNTIPWLRRLGTVYNKPEG